MIKTALEKHSIAYDTTSNSRNQRVIMNRLFRQQDESYLAPIQDKFNVTNRAIRKARNIESINGKMRNAEYALFIEAEISRIVNS